MSNVIFTGDTSGTLNLAAPLIAGTNTQTLVAATGTLAPLISGTAQASTSGTSIDFTGIPSWVKRITVIFNGVSTNGSSFPLIQIGNGSVITTGYSSGGAGMSAGGNGTTTSTAGFVVAANAASYILNGHMVLTLVSGNTWVESHAIQTITGVVVGYVGGGNIALGGTLDRVRITTVNGTDAFDAGSINILYE